MTIGKFELVPSKVTSRWANDRPVRRVPFGLGAAAGAPGAAERCLKCSFGNVPVIEESILTFSLPLTDAQIAATFGDVINPLAAPPNLPGLASLDTTFVAPGVLQTDIYTTGIGVHLFCEPLSFVAFGNGFPANPAPATYPPSPDVYTTNDLTAGHGTGLSGLVDGTTIAAALLEWGEPTWKAAYHMANAYQFQWKTSQRELVINEQVADVSYMGSFADAEAAGTSEVPVIDFQQIVNAQYRALGAVGGAAGPFVFMTANYRRVGSFNTTPGSAGTNTGNFHPTRDYDVAPVTWGGLRWQGYGCRGQMYRQIEAPCFLERGIPISMSFNVNDPVHQARMQQALSIDNVTASMNLLPDVNATALVTTGLPELATTIAGAGDIQVLQVVSVARQVFKGGIFKVAIKIKGWEMPGAWKQWCMQNVPQMFNPASPGNPSPQVGT